MIVSGNGTANWRTSSTVPSSMNVSMSWWASATMPGSICPTRFGENALLTSARYRECDGGSLVSSVLVCG